MNLLAWACAALALLCLGAGGGVAWQARHQATDIVNARTDLHTCQGNAADQALALGEFRRRAKQATDDLAALRAAAQTALDQRDALAAVIQTQATARERAVKQVTHETTDCQQLAVMPVCPAVAGRLWGQVAAPDTHTDY